MAEESFERLQQQLNAAGCDYEVIDHQPAATTQEAAAASHLSGYDFAKAVVVTVDNQPHLHVLRAADSLDLDSLRAQLGGAHDVRMAREDEFEQLFPGTTAAPPALPLTDGMPVHVDRRLVEDHEAIAFEAGDGRHAIRMPAEDYLRISRGQLGDFAEAPRRVARRRRPRGPLRSPWTLALSLGAIAGGAALIWPRGLGRRIGGRSGRLFTAGAATGAALALLSDPRAGARRRHLVRDKAGRWARKTAWWTRRKGAYYGGRLDGIQHEMEEATRAGSRGSGS